MCALGNGGLFRPMDAWANPCPGGMTWGVWWHESAMRAFATHATSSPCQMEVAVEPTRLTGTFACHGLTNDGATERIDLLDGRFEFTLAPRPDGSRP